MCVGYSSGGIVVTFCFDGSVLSALLCFFVWLLDVYLEGVVGRILMIRLWRRNVGWFLLGCE